MSASPVDTVLAYLRRLINDNAISQAWQNTLHTQSTTEHDARTAHNAAFHGRLLDPYRTLLNFEAEEGQELIYVVTDEDGSLQNDCIGSCEEIIYHFRAPTGSSVDDAVWEMVQFSGGVRYLLDVIPRTYVTDPDWKSAVRLLIAMQPATGEEADIIISGDYSRIVTYAQSGNAGYALSTEFLTGKQYFEYEVLGRGDTGHSVAIHCSDGTDPDTAGTQNETLTWQYHGKVQYIDVSPFTLVDVYPNNNVATEWNTGDILGFAVDCDTGKVWLSLNGAWLGAGDPGAGTGEVYQMPTPRGFYPYWANPDAYTSGSVEIESGHFKFDSVDWTYTAPTGFEG